jgi:hypothetical protein
MFVAHSVRASQGNDGRSIVSADSSYRSEKLSVSVDAGFRHDERQKLLKSDMRLPLTPAASTLDSRSALVEHRWRDVPSASADAEYPLDEMDSMSGSFSWQRTGGPRKYTQTTTTNGASATVTGVSERLSRGHAADTDYDERLGYVRKLARKGEELHRSELHWRNRSGVPPWPASMRTRCGGCWDAAYGDAGAIAAMMGLPAGVRIWLAAGFTDLRKYAPPSHMQSSRS